MSDAIDLANVWNNAHIWRTLNQRHTDFQSVAHMM
jgi:hypothetical protein